MDSKTKMKVLVITYLPWRNDVNVGNTLSNIFKGMEDRVEFASIYFQNSMPDNSLAHRYFRISEKELLKSIITRKAVGEEIFVKSTSTQPIERFSMSYNKVRQLRWDVFLLAQDLIGLLGNWKSRELDQFVNDFQPDLIFGPLGRVPVANNLMVYLNEKYGIPLVTYPWDDHYSLKKLSFSPFFWIKTFVERKAIEKCASHSEFLYTITEQMRDEYSKYFDKECKVLYKGYNFGAVAPIKRAISEPVKIVYMGNIGAGRWNVIAKVAESIRHINQTGKKAELFVYTLSPKSKEIEKKLNIEGVAYLMDPVPNSEVMSTMQSADILLHVEPTKIKERLFFRLSFSTKLVDYFFAARCILALGGDTAAMAYLRKNDVAIIELNDNKIEATLSKLLNDKNMIKNYAKRAWNCGVKNHQLSTIQKFVYDDFCRVIAKTEIRS